MHIFASSQAPAMRTGQHSQRAVEAQRDRKKVEEERDADAPGLVIVYR
jgi:hypothetical protein